MAGGSHSSNIWKNPRNVETNLGGQEARGDLVTSVPTDISGGVPNIPLGRVTIKNRGEPVDVHVAMTYTNGTGLPTSGNVILVRNPGANQVVIETPGITDQKIGDLLGIAPHPPSNHSFQWADQNAPQGPNIYEVQVTMFPLGAGAESIDRISIQARSVIA